MIKKFLIFGVISLFCVCAHATIMCAADDTLAIVLDPQVRGTKGDANKDLSEWTVTFPYGTVWGHATCVTTRYGTPTDTLIDTDTGNIATGGERAGKNCWCQMTHPLKSRWVFQSDGYSSAADCRSFCASNCRGSALRGEALLGTLFGSVTN